MACRKVKRYANCSQRVVISIPRVPRAVEARRPAGTAIRRAKALRGPRSPATRRRSSGVREDRGGRGKTDATWRCTPEVGSAGVHIPCPIIASINLSAPRILEEAALEGYSSVRKTADFEGLRSLLDSLPQVLWLSRASCKSFGSCFWRPVQAEIGHSF